VKGEPAKRKRSKAKSDRNRRGVSKQVQYHVEEELSEANLNAKTVPDLFFHCMKERDFFKVKGSIELYRCTVAHGVDLEAGTFATGKCFGNQYLKVCQQCLMVHDVVLLEYGWVTCFKRL